MRDKQDQAVALSYDEGSESAPKVVAKGRGFLAEQIKKLAEEHGVPIHRDGDLVELLSQIDIDREVPPELYSAVAEILSWIYKANGEIRKEVFHDN